MCLDLAVALFSNLLQLNFERLLCWLRTRKLFISYFILHTFYTTYISSCIYILMFVVDREFSCGKLILEGKKDTKFKDTFYYYVFVKEVLYPVINMETVVF